MPLGHAQQRDSKRIYTSLNPYCIGYASWAYQNAPYESIFDCLNPYCIGYASWAADAVVYWFPAFFGLHIPIFLPFFLSKTRLTVPFLR